MHKKFSWFLAFCAMAIGLSACGKDPGSVVNIFNVNADTITIGSATGTTATTFVSATVNPSEIFTCSTSGPTTAVVSIVTVNPANAKVTVVALDPGIASFNNGFITTVSPGIARFKATIDGTNTVINFTVKVTGCTTTTPSVSFVPHGGSITVGSSVTLQITCGTNTACTNPVVTSSNTAIIGVNGATLTCLAVGLSHVTVSATGATSDAADFTCTAANTAIQLTPPGPFTLHTGQFCLASAAMLHIAANMPANWTLTNTGLIIFQGANTNTSSVDLLATAGQTGAPVTITATSPTGGSASATITVDNTPCASNPIVSSLTSLNVNNCAGFTVGYTPTMTINGLTVTGTWSTSNPAVATVNAAGNGFNLTGTAGTANITFTATNGSTFTIPVTVNQCAAGINVVVTPSTFALTVGQAPLTFACTVSNVPAGQQTGCTWASFIPGTIQTGANCVALTTLDANHVSVSAIAGCTQQIEIRGMWVVDNTKFGSAFGTTSSGNIACVITAQDGSTSGNIILPKGQTTGLTTSCTNQFGASFTPFWYVQSGGSVARVNGSTTVVTIGTGANAKQYPAGAQAQLFGVAAGTDLVTAQANVADKTVLGQRTIIVQ
jgi:hypothetical protein